MNLREQRAQQMMREPDYAAQTGRGEFWVRSQTGPDKSYTVRGPPPGWSASVPIMHTGRPTASTSRSCWR